MRLLFDTSTLVAALLKPHEAHSLAHSWLDQVLAGVHTGVLSAHSLAELYSTLTRMLLQPKLTATDALDLIRENVLSSFEIIGLTPADYMAILEDLQSRNLVGGVTYDALIMYVAIKASVDKVITLNGRDFMRLFRILVVKSSSCENDYSITNNSNFCNVTPLNYANLQSW